MGWTIWLRRRRGWCAAAATGFISSDPGAPSAPAWPETIEIDRLDGTITFLAAAPDGRLALATEEGGVRIGRPGAWHDIDLPREQARCVTAGRFLPDGRLALCVGSTRNPASQWKRDLMQHGASGCGPDRRPGWG